MPTKSLVRACLLAASLATAGCAGPKLIDTGRVAIVDAGQLSPPTAGDANLALRPYVIGPGDELTIDVFGLPELNREARVDPEGNIAVPMGGSLAAAGRTPQEVARAIEDHLRVGYVREPKVSVGVSEMVSQTIAVEGAVTKPGIYPIIGRMTLMRAIARAEGTSEVARANHVVVFRTVDGRQMAALYDLRAIRLAAYEDPEIYKNDVVVVGESAARRLFPQALQGAGVLLTPLVALLNNN